MVAATQVVFTAVAALIMDKAGRKILLIISGTNDSQDQTHKPALALRHTPVGKWSLWFKVFPWTDYP